MATLVRVRTDHDDENDEAHLLANIPAPFPVHLLHNDSVAEDVPNHTLLDASLDAVQHSALVTLANILALPPTCTQHIPMEQALAESPLACTIRALLERDTNSVCPSLSDTALLTRLRDHVDAVAPSLDAHDARLAQAIVALLLDLGQLPASSLPTTTHPASSQDTDISPSSRYATIASLRRQLSFLQPSTRRSSAFPVDPQVALLWTRINEQLDTVVSLCRARASPPRPIADLRPSFDTLPPEYDAEFHDYPDEHPPSYASSSHLHAFSGEKPSDDVRPADQYPPEKISLHPSTSACPPSTQTTIAPPVSSNSLDLDLDTITCAIERLYAVAPQLANQRVELRREKIVQMEMARAGKGKAPKLADTLDPELDKLLDLLGKASAREISDQSVVIDPRRTAREKCTADIEEQRRKYLEHLLYRTYAGRLHSQDAMPSSSSSTGSGIQDAHDDQTSVLQLDGRGSRDSKRASYPADPSSGSTLEPPPEKLRNRSLSAPHLAWLKPRDKLGSSVGTKESSDSVSRSLSSAPKSFAPTTSPRSVRGLSGRLCGASKSQSPPISEEGVNHGGLDIAYVAEHHETLKHVLLFVAYASPSSSSPSGIPSAEVPPSTTSGTYGDCLFLRLAGTPSPPLALPVPVVPGSKTVLSRSGHWEIKASCCQSDVAQRENEDLSPLPASELTSLSPLLYTCSSCSLPLVPAPPARYRDLPSEHWEELIEAWMCHPEGQTFVKMGSNDDGKANSLDFWPSRDEVLVGGSYMLFDAEAARGGNIKCVGGRETIVVLPPTNVLSLLEAPVGFEERFGNTRLARCLCGAVLGRQHERKSKDGQISRMYRVFKYAIRPVSTVSKPRTIPISVFVLSDMVEHVQAHATYRFVLSDVEDERPRILIWLFKPRLRISYMLPTSSLLPRSGTVDASKILYKILGPTSATSDFKDILNKYPGFPQAEHLFYPMDVCRKLAALLKESTGSYPEGMRTMTGLDVGWLTMI